MSRTKSAVSRWALLTAIAAVGMKTSLRKLLDVGGPAIALVAGYGIESKIVDFTINGMETGLLLLFLV